MILCGKTNALVTKNGVLGSHTVYNTNQNYFVDVSVGLLERRGFRIVVDFYLW